MNHMRAEDVKEAGPEGGRRATDKVGVEEAPLRKERIQDRAIEETETVIHRGEVILKTEVTRDQQGINTEAEVNQGKEEHIMNLWKAEGGEAHQKIDAQNDHTIKKSKQEI